MSRRASDPVAGETPSSRRGIVDLIGEFGDETATLVRQEIALAKAEVNEKLDRAESAAIELSSGLVVALAGVLALVASAILLLSAVMPAWVAALLVGGALSVVGAALLARAKTNLKKTKPTNSRAVDEARATKNMLEEELS